MKGLFRKRPGIIQIIVNLELLVYLIVYQYILDAGRIFQTIPYMQNIQTPNTIVELILYLGGLAHITVLLMLDFIVMGTMKHVLAMLLGNCVFLLPFAILSFSLQLLWIFFNIIAGPDLSNTEMIEWLAVAFSLVLVLLMLIFLPYFIQKIWLCKSLPEGELKNRLMKICPRASFKHAGMKTWTIMHDQLTAGIIGIVPRFRYIMFTDRLLRELPPESIEAILAHEIGHNKHKHLLIYPFILAGMIVCAGLFFIFSQLLSLFSGTRKCAASVDLVGSF